MKTIEAPRSQVAGPAASPGLPFPRFHLTFHDPLPAGTTAETVLDAVEAAVRRLGRARRVTRGADRVDFVGPSASGSGTSLLGRATGPGAVWIEREGDAFYVRYALGFEDLYRLWGLMAVFGVLFAWIGGEPAFTVVMFVGASFPALLAMTLTVADFDTGLRKAVLIAARKAAEARIVAGSPISDSLSPS